MKSNELDLLVNKALRKIAAIPMDQLQAAAAGLPGQAPPPGAPAGGPPMDPSMMAGGMPPGQMPMDPSMMGGAPPMDPAAMGGMDPSMTAGMDPSMMGGAPPMDPAAAGPDPVLQQIDQIHKMVKQVRTIVATMAQALDVKIALNELLESADAEDPVKDNAEPGPKSKESSFDDDYGNYLIDEDSDGIAVSDERADIANSPKYSAAENAPEQARGNLALAVSLFSRKIARAN